MEGNAQQKPQVTPPSLLQAQEHENLLVPVQELSFRDTEISTDMPEAPEEKDQLLPQTTGYPRKGFPELGNSHSLPQGHGVLPLTNVIPPFNFFSEYIFLLNQSTRFHNIGGTLPARSPLFSIRPDPNEELCVEISGSNFRTCFLKKAD